MKVKALAFIAAFLAAFLVFSSFESAFAQSSPEGSWQEVARGAEAIWERDHYGFYSTFDDDRDGWILWEYSEPFSFSMWEQCYCDENSWIDACLSAGLKHKRQYQLYSSSSNWTITCEVIHCFESWFWQRTGHIEMALYNGTEEKEWYEFTPRKGATDYRYYVWIWNNGSKLYFRLRWKTSGLFGERIWTNTFSIDVPSNFFANVTLRMKAIKEYGSGKISCRIIYEKLYEGGANPEPENIKPLPSWIQSAVDFVLTLFYMLSSIVIGVAPYAGVGFAIWILSGVVTAAETGEFSKIWEPFIKIYSLFTGIISIVVKAIKTIWDYIIKFLEWIGIVGVAA
ncbi:hypothetical protein DRO69_00690 [Candidatus Bathyarchaeota archaeon]|nr:MAG: hypothetical protein DRO69_00690 [Candidatus Bathyarchaeota archaeon]